MPNPRWLSYSLLAQTFAIVLLVGIEGWRETSARLLLLCGVILNTIGLIDTINRKGK